MTREDARVVRVYLVDDHAVVREGLRGSLSARPDIDVVGEAGSVGEALRGMLDVRPSVALVDVQLPDGSGIELIRDVRSRAPQIRCIVFTSFANDEAFFHAVVAGAAGYVVKDAALNEVVHAIRVVAEGGTLIRPEVIDDLRRRATAMPANDELLANLTAQERRILGMVTRGLTNREIAVELSLAEKTVRNYVSNILAKVGMKNRTQLAAYVAGSARRQGR